MRGKKPKPTAQQIAEGDPRKKGIHKLEEQLAREPKPIVGLGPCPNHVKGLARRAWHFWRDQLEAMDMDRRPDAMMLEGACVNYARAAEADQIIAREGMMVEEWKLLANGEFIVARRRKHPAVEISARCWGLTKAFCSEFGLSPGSRTRFSMAGDRSGEDDLSKLLNQPRTPPSGDPSTVH